MSLLSALGTVLLLGGVTAAPAQEAHAENVTGHAAAGKPLYQRYCIGCHGQDGDGAGENAMWIDPKPRDFTAGVFKCRSTPSGSLPTDADLFESVTRGFVTTNMPPWIPLMPQNGSIWWPNIKTFSPRWKGAAAPAPITIPSETPASIESILHGRKCSSGSSAGSATARRDTAMALGLDAYRQQGQPDPAVQLFHRVAVQMRGHEPGSVPHLHDGSRRHTDAVVHR